MSHLSAAAAVLERVLLSDDGRTSPRSVLRTWYHTMNAHGYSLEEITWAFNQAMESACEEIPLQVVRDLGALLKYLGDL